MTKIYHYVIIVRQNKREEKMEQFDELLLIACKNKGASEALILTQMGADVNCKGIFETPLLNAVRNGDSETVKVLLDAGAKVNDNSFGTTPLIETILFGRESQLDGNYIKNFLKINYYEILVLLLEKGALLTKEDDDGKSALYHIVESGLINDLRGLIRSMSKVTDAQIDEMIDKVRENGFYSQRVNYSISFER